MILRPTSATRTDARCPYTTLFRSIGLIGRVDLGLKKEARQLTSYLRYLVLDYIPAYGGNTDNCQQQHNRRNDGHLDKREPLRHMVDSCGHSPSFSKYASPYWLA